MDRYVDPQNPICPCRPEGLLEDPSSVTAKPVVVYSPLMNRNVSELSGSVRSHWKTNTPVAQQKTPNNGNRPDLRAANPLLAGSSRRWLRCNACSILPDSTDGWCYRSRLGCGRRRLGRGIAVVVVTAVVVDSPGRGLVFVR
jgi:hypothetical protein